MISHLEAVEFGGLHRICESEDDDLYGCRRRWQQEGSDRTSNNERDFRMEGKQESEGKVKTEKRSGEDSGPRPAHCARDPCRSVQCASIFIINSILCTHTPMVSISGCVHHICSPSASKYIRDTVNVPSFLPDHQSHRPYPATFSHLRK